MAAEPNKYLRTIKDARGLEALVDVYDVLRAFEVHDPAVAHAVKKLLCPGSRGVKGRAQDINEAVEALGRAL